MEFTGFWRLLTECHKTCGIFNTIDKKECGVPMTLKELSKLQAVPIMELKREELSDMDEAMIFPSESQSQRMQSFLGQVKNPFAQKVGAYILQIGYMEGAEDTLDERMLLFARRQTRTGV